jgi:hypothetical protein
MARTAGADLGTTNSVVPVLEYGEPDQTAGLREAQEQAASSAQKTGAALHGRARSDGSARQGAADTAGHGADDEVVAAEIVVDGAQRAGRR